MTPSKLTEKRCETAEGIAGSGGCFLSAGESTEDTQVGFRWEVKPHITMGFTCVGKNNSVCLFVCLSSRRMIYQGRQSQRMEHSS